MMDNMERRQKWRFTFGSDQAHPGKCQPIIGTYEEARQKMFDMYGNKWSFQYSEKDWEYARNNPKRRWKLEEDMEVIEL